METRLAFKNTRSYLTAFFLLTAAAGNAAPALAEIIEEPAMGPVLALNLPQESASKGTFWKISPAQAEKFFAFFKGISTPVNPAKKPAVIQKRRQPLDPFKAARALMTSA